MSNECIEFISRLLDKNPETRLGSRSGISEILDHPWMSKIDVDGLIKKKVEAPFKPELSSDPLDVRYFDQTFTKMEAIDTIIPQYS